MLFSAAVFTLYTKLITNFILNALSEHYFIVVYTDFRASSLIGITVYHLVYLL